LAAYGVLLAIAWAGLAGARGDIQLELLAQWGGPSEAVAVDGNLAYLAVGHRLVILDISDPENPALVGRTSTLTNPVRGVAVSGAHAFVVADWLGLVVYDLSDPGNPAQVGWFDTDGQAMDVLVSGDLAYVADGDAGLQIINIATPTAPFREGGYHTGGFARGVTVAGPYAFVADGPGGLQIIDVSDPGNPFWESEYTGLPDEAAGVTVVGDYAYVADGYYGGLHVINVSDPGNPLWTGACGTDGSAGNVVVVGDFAYVANGWAGLAIIDVADPEAPFKAGGCETDGWSLDLTLAAGHAFLADYSRGLQVIEVSSPPAASWVGEYRTGSSGEVTDLAVSGDYLYISDGGAGGGVQVLDVSDPTAPVWLGGVFTHEFAWGLTQSGDYVYLADGCAGLGVIDVSDPNDPQRIGNAETGCAARDVMVQDRYAYVADDHQSLLVLDVYGPYLPTLVGQWQDPQNPGYALGIAVRGDYVYLANAEPGLEIIDVSDPYHPTRVGHYQTASPARDVALARDFAYVGCDWGGLEVIDIHDPYDPLWVGRCDNIGPVLGVVVQGIHAYLACCDWGVQIVDITNPAAPFWVGNFNTDGAARRVALSGGRIYVADGDDGVVILANRDFVWSNPAGGSFGDPGNWTPLGPPGAADRAVFSLPDAYAVTFDADHTNDTASVENGEVSLDLGGFTYSLEGEFSLYVGPWEGNAGALSLSNGTLAAHYIGLGGQVGAEGHLSLIGPETNLVMDPDGGSLDVGIDGAATALLADAATAQTFVTKVGLYGPGELTVTGDGSHLSVAGDLLVGELSHGTVRIESGAAVEARFLLAGNNRVPDGPFGIGDVFVDGPGSRLDLLAEAYVGGAGQGSLAISNGATASTAGLTMIGCNSTTQGQLRIESGGQLTSGWFGFIGRYAGSFGEATVTGVNSSWTITEPDNALVVGDLGQGVLSISDGGSVTVATGVVAGWAGSAGNVTITGPQSSWTNTNGLILGREGPGTLLVEHGGTVATTSFANIGELVGGNGAVTITDPDSQWLAQQAEIWVGSSGQGTLDVRNGANVSAGSALAAVWAGSTGDITVSDPGSTFSTTVGMLIGREGVGSLVLEQRATVFTGDWLTIAEQPGGEGRVTIQDGGAADVDGVFLAYWADSQAHLTVSGAAATLTSRRQIQVGRSGSGEMLVTSGAAATSYKADSATGSSGIIGAQADGVGTVTVKGNGSLWTQDGALSVGWYGDGTLNVDSGAVVESADGIIGRLPGSSGTATISGTGSLWAISGSLTVGGLPDATGGTGTLDVSADAIVTVADRLMLWEAGAVDLDGGIVVVGSGGVPAWPDTVSVLADGELAGSGTITGQLFNAGTVGPGASAGVLRVNGDYLQDAAGAVQIELGGYLVGSEYDRLAITGAADLDGLLDVSLTGGFVPAPNSAFDIMTYGSHAGTFATVSLPTGIPDRRFGVFVGPTAVTLRVGLRGDVNCDGVVGFRDINPFVLMLSNPEAWQAQYPNCPKLTGDINDDGLVNFKDINPFVALLSGR
jgi:T5SS/PEP-CTERM-associated repeat protein